MRITYCKSCNHIYYSFQIEHYCRKCSDVLVEVTDKFSDVTNMNINERYKLAYELSKDDGK